MPRKQRFKPSRKPKPEALAEEATPSPPGEPETSAVDPPGPTGFAPDDAGDRVS